MADEFYTREDLARHWAQKTAGRWPSPDVLFVEPSAGTGAFVRPLLDMSRKVRAVDINPQCRGVVKKGDFLMPHRLFAGEHSGIVVIGNPPFGKNASTAVRFFNCAARHSDEIAFIVPRTFRKLSLQNRLNPYFHLSDDEDVPDNAFIKDGKPHDVPCAWQVWTRRPVKRAVPQPPDISHMVQFTSPAEADFAMRRVGFYAGRITTKNIMSLSETTHYFMRERQGGVLNTLRQISWLEVAAQTAGVRSLSKTEIAYKLGDEYHV